MPFLRTTLVALAAGITTTGLLAGPAFAAGPATVANPAPTPSSSPTAGRPATAPNTPWPPTGWR